MRRYRVYAVNGGNEIPTLLVPFSETSTVRELGEDVIRRVRRQNITFSEGQPEIRLFAADGPLLDPTDVLQDAVRPEDEESIYVISAMTGSEVSSTTSRSRRNSHRQHRSERRSGGHRVSSGTESIISSVSSRSSRSYGNARYNPTPSVSAISEISSRRLPLLRALENPSSAFDIPDDVSFTTSRTVRSQSSTDTIRAEVRRPANQHFRLRIITPRLARNGFESIRVSPEVFSLRSCLQDIRLRVFEEVGVPQVDAADTVDIYIQDILIETLHYDIRLSDLGIEDCLIDGVLDVFVVVRPKVAENNGSVPPGISVLRKLEQTDRGCAAFLACLRVFKAKIKTSKIDERQQENILRVFYRVTRFFPILRVIRAMMGGYAIGDAEVSMLVLCFAEILKEMFNSDEGIRVTRGDPNRVFEGSRLIFAYILDRATQIQYSDANSPLLLASYRTVDCTDAVTRRRIHDPIQTDAGIVSRSTLVGNSDIQREGDVPRITSRILLLTDSDCEEYSYFHYDTTMSACAQTVGIDDSIVTDLNYLSAACSAHDLSVLQPNDLNGVAEPPCLTWDIDGLLAAFVGHAACALPGQDLEIYLPITGIVKTIDSALFTQALQPILEARKADGTIVFEESGPPLGRKETDPSELIIFVVDCSRSMERSSEFMTNDPAPANDEQEEERINCDFIIRSLHFTACRPNITLAERFISEHHSFQDMVAMVRLYEPLADKIVDFLILLENRRLEYLYRERESTRARLTSRIFQMGDSYAVSDIHRTVSVVKSLESFRQELVRLLKVAAGIDNNDIRIRRPEVWKWIPESASTTGTPVNFLDTLSQMVYDEIPDEFLCPITREIFDDPVETSDGFIYERAAIRRWFENSSSSPTTGLNLTNTSLRSHQTMLRRSVAWVKAEDILGTRTTNAYQRGRRIDVSFRKGGNSFTRSVSVSLSVLSLYRVAFRGFKGLVADFGLLFGGFHENPNNRERIALIPDGRQLSELGINRSCFVEVLEREEYQSYQDGVSGDNLIKIYNKRGRFKFGFWHPTVRPLLSSAILIKIWRNRVEKYHSSSHRTKLRKLGSYVPDREVWYHMCNSGDGQMRGHSTQSWSDITQLRVRSTGDLTASEDFLSTNECPEGHKVLKLGYYKYRGRAVRPTARRNVNLTRLEVSKEIFSNFINRTIAYDYPNHCGLIPFNSAIGTSVSQEITFDLETFRGRVMGMAPDGDTPLWDALSVAINSLNGEATRFENVKKRIVCLSDGADTSSSSRATDILHRARQNDIIIDCFCIGDYPRDLMWVCHNTGGYKFNPRNMEEAMAVVELEPVLSVLERPDLRPSTIEHHARATATSCSRNSYPKRKEHPNMNDTFTKIEYLDDTDQPTRRDSSSGSRNNVRSSRIMMEIRRIAGNPHPYYDIYVCNENMGFWKIVMQGPAQSAYSTGAFTLCLDMDESYPLFAPKARFITPILHPNINKHGKVCHSIFDRNWTTNTTNVQILQTIFTLLAVPETSDAINVTVALDYRWENTTFRQEVREYIERHATQNRSQLRAEIDGDEAGTVVDTEAEIATYYTASETVSESTLYG